MRGDPRWRLRPRPAVSAARWAHGTAGRVLGSRNRAAGDLLGALSLLRYAAQPLHAAGYGWRRAGLRHWDRPRWRLTSGIKEAGRALRPRPPPEIAISRRAYSGCA